MDKHATIYVAGHAGLAGSAIVRALRRSGYHRIVCRTSQEVDLRDAAQVNRLFASEKIDYVFLAAAKVGGIGANSRYPVDFIRDNLLIQTNVIDAAWRYRVEGLLFLGSSCIYPKLAPQPLREDALLTGPLEPTNEPYAIAKIAGIRMCQAYNRQYGTRFLSAMPTNLYGPGDNFDLERSHVLPALMRKFHEAKRSCAPYVGVWGTGKPLREFLHADDMAEACLVLMQRAREADEIVNIGCGREIAISELAELIRDIVRYEGEIRYETDRPDGTPRKLLDISKLAALGWRPRIPLAEGISSTYEWYVRHTEGDRITVEPSISAG